MHIPVLKEKVIEILDPKENENFIDCTFGEGGHTKAILKKTAPNGKVLAVEIDPVLYEKGKELERKFKGRLILIHGSFKNLKAIVRAVNFSEIKGILFDLGVCSWHFESAKRGFSFKREEPLIMRYDNDLSKICAFDVLNSFSQKEIERILKEFAQEKFAFKIAKEIVKEREKSPIRTTLQLVKIIERVVGEKRGKIHPATKTFLALRIFVNEELENLKEGLKDAFELLNPGGKIAVISFHSGEDKIVKNFFKTLEKDGLAKILTKKPITPQPKEIAINPKSRSAKLRVIQKIK